MKRRDFLKGSLAAGVGAAGVTRAAGCAIHSRTSGPGPEPGETLLTPADLRCESTRNPLGIDALRPRLSWKLLATRGARNQIQSSYRIMVASDSTLLAGGGADLWDSGRVFSSRQLHVEYEGPALASGQRCFWQVQVWDGEGRPSRPSEISWWEMGLLSPEAWTGSWISDGSKGPASQEAFYDDDPAPLFRRTFLVGKGVKRARLYVVGLGYCELRLNGRRLSDHALDPAWTSFGKRVFYTSEDLTERLVEGENVLGAVLGNGWFNPLPMLMWGRINIRDHLLVGRPQVLVQLNIEYGDGSVQTVATDEAWKVKPGPILRNSVYLGERYDARLEEPGWDEPGHDDRSWDPASRADPVPGELRASPIPPIRVTSRLTPITMREISPGAFIFDLGQNFAGWVKLRVEGPRGTTVRMRMGERIYSDGTLNPMTAVAGQIKGLREDGTPRGGPGAPEIGWQANEYTLRGDGMEEYTPRFTFHGLRYVEVTGYPGTPTLDSIEGLRLNTDVESVGSFSCSNERFNRLHEVVQWTLLSNLFSVQSDCPGREKFQYGGDIVATSEMAIFGYDMASFYAKTVADHSDAARGEGWFTETAPFVGIAAGNYVEGAGPISWGLAHPLLMAQLYQYYGDRRLIEEHFEAARTWVDLLEDHSDGFIIDRCIGDHETLDPNPVELIATAHFYQSAVLVAGLAEILGRRQAEVRYRRLALEIRSAFLERFMEAGTGRVGPATQAAQATALHLGLVPEGEVEAATQRMIDEVLDTHGGHIATGIFGTKHLLNALFTAGQADVAYRMVDEPSYPGWGHMLERGATTLWETWAESDDVYSQNHPMFGSVSEWFYKCLAGIMPEADAVGFDRFQIAPSVPEGLPWVDATYVSVRGTVRSSWRLEGGLLHLDVEVPVNTTAVVQIPTGDPASIREGGLLLGQAPSVRELTPTSPDTARVELGSGWYSFTAAAP
ncbi:MAG: family 78 glycoside hydrolase catalytic domain [Gemmatimonadetes bacterium]|nr:family 78 glycoside hydrolase catalytic domain [Gemmatimonadota bacterium]NNM03761.1 family 78 glycoside hydrolase catalytic domain [Gemmatimonadota bacterium]